MSLLLGSVCSYMSGLLRAASQGGGGAQVSDGCELPSGVNFQARLGPRWPPHPEGGSLSSVLCSQLYCVTLGNLGPLTYWGQRMELELCWP